MSCEPSNELRLWGCFRPVVTAARYILMRNGEWMLMLILFLARTFTTGTVNLFKKIYSVEFYPSSDRIVWYSGGDWWVGQMDLSLIRVRAAEQGGRVQYCSIPRLVC